MPNAGKHRYNGLVIQALRRKSSLNRQAFATAVDIGTPHLSNIEAGRRQPSDDLAMKMAAVLGITDLRVIIGDPAPLPDIPVPPLAVD